MWTTRVSGTWVRVLAADILSGPLSGSYDVAILRGVLIVPAPDQVRQALANVSRAIEPGGAIYVIGWILDDSRVSPVDLAAYDLLFLNEYDHAQLWSEGEIRAWLTEAGFREITRSPGAFGADFIMARKATAS